MKQLLEINGHLLNIHSTGPDDGPVVLFLHHGLGAIRSWKEQIPVFSAAGYQVISYDRWGHGKSASRQHWSMPDFEPDLADLEAILSRFDHQPVSIVGHSDGGNIAMLYALAHPDQVACLIIIAAHIYVEPKMISSIQVIRDRFESDPRFRIQLQRVHGENTKHVFLGWFNGWTNPGINDWDMQDQLTQIASPTLVVQGLEDEHASPQHARDLASAIPEADLWLVPGASHMLPQQMPEKFNPLGLEFLEQVTKIPTTHI
jgi:pimeloyl-ACP methyl ester carboxylesterase